MAKEIDAAIKAIQDEALKMAGVSKAPDYVPGTAPDNIFAICMPGTGRCGAGPGSGRRTGQHRIKVFVGKALKDLARDEAAILPYGDLFMNTILDEPTLGAQVTGVVGDIEYTFLTDFMYSGIQHIGWEFIVPVKIISATS